MAVVADVDTVDVAAAEKMEVTSSCIQRHHLSGRYADAEWRCAPGADSDQQPSA